MFVLVNPRSPAHQRRQFPAVRLLIPLLQGCFGSSRVLVDDHPPVLQLPPGGEERPYRILSGVASGELQVPAFEGILASVVCPCRLYEIVGQSQIFESRSNRLQRNRPATSQPIDSARAMALSWTSSAGVPRR